MSEAQHSAHPIIAENAKCAGGLSPTDLPAPPGQHPQTLWIGCSDSRVSEYVIPGVKPGDIFVHRNIANQFHLKDDNALSVLQYAIDALHVPHVAVVGHSECGGAHACLEPHESGNDPLDRWLASLRHIAETQGITTVPALVEANVRAQVSNLAKTKTIRKAWASGVHVQLHGWIYDISTGILRDLHIHQPSSGQDDAEDGISSENEKNANTIAERYIKHYQ